MQARLIYIFMNKKILYSIIICLLLLAASSIWLKEWDRKVVTDVTSGSVEISESNVSIDEDDTSSNIVGDTNSNSVSDIADLFSADPTDPNNNIVGHFAYGSFYWYVPDWVAQKWEVNDNENGMGMKISPKNVSEKDLGISDITIAVNYSNETYNAITLYEEDRQSNEGELVMDEVFLNSHRSTPSAISINVETNTRIYHVVRNVDGEIHDRYYIDGTNGRTAYISFFADEEAYAMYGNKIKQMVEGIGAGRAEQG